jgi:hypothetical protein
MYRVVSELVQKYFDVHLTEAQIARIRDRFISPAKMIHLCQQYESRSVEDLLDIAFGKEPTQVDNHQALVKSL